MRRLRFIWLALIPIAIASTAFLALVHAEPVLEATPPAAPGCLVDLTKIADPTVVNLGDTLQVTMVMSHTCPAFVPPLDLLFLVDISNSMTTGDKRNRLTDPCGIGPDPGSDPFPTKELPPETPGTPTEPVKTPPSQVEPTKAVSNTVPTRPPVLPIDPTQGPVVDPNPTKPPTPPIGTPGEPTEPVKTPPSHLPPTSGPPPGYDRDPGEDPGKLNLIRDEAQFIRDFIREPAVQQAAASGQLRIGLIAFESRPHTIASMTSKLTRINSGVSRLENLPHGKTNISLGFYRANQNLFRGQKGARIVNRAIVVMSDGKFDQRTIRGLRQRKDVLHFAIAMGPSPDHAKLNDIVTEREYQLGWKDYQKFVEYYGTVMQPPRAAQMVRAVIRDDLADNMKYIDDSASPPSPTSTFQAGVIEWRFEPPAQRITMTYEVEPLEPGTWPISDSAVVDWEDAAARTGNKSFPAVQVNVLPPTPTPTPLTPVPTSTPTSTPPPSATATPRPSDLYLPITINAWPPAEPTEKPCVPSESTVDVALIIDTSDSMLEALPSGGGTKLDAAISAAQGLVDQLKLDGRDQVTVIGFNREAYVATPLTGDKARITAALQYLPNTQATGTKMNEGLEAAYVQLTGPGHKPENHASVVLLTDGWHMGPSDEVREVADRLKAAEISIYTIGLGDQVDQALLLEIATGPDYYYFSPDASGLEEIYRRIAQYIPCP
jgi:Mg-chelatase subunit ChlD